MASAVLLVGACSGPDDGGVHAALDPTDAADATTTDSDDTSPEASPDADSTPAETADASHDADVVDVADTPTDSAESTDAEEGPPPGPPVCGDGWVDTSAGEECDDGRGSADESRRGCTATCRVRDLVADRPASGDADASTLERTLGHGRHPIAASTTGDYAVAFVQSGGPSPSVHVTAFDRKGFAADDAIAADVGTTALFESNPVVAALSSGRFAVAFTDFDGDGDEEGIALRIVDTTAGAVGALTHANSTTVFSQFDPDILAVGVQVVVAWVDESAVATGQDVKIRTFDSTLHALTAETTLAATIDAEGDVALAPFGSSYAAAWKASSATSGLETLHVHAGAVDWSVGPYLPGPSTVRPAIVELDATHLLAAFLEASGDADAGALAYSLRAAVLDVASPGATTDFALTTSVTADAGASTDVRDIAATRVGDTIFVAWRTSALVGDPLGDETWLETLTWSGGALASSAEVPLPRWEAHRAGDQRAPALVSTPLPPGGALGAAWDDDGLSLEGEGARDVVVELMPIPMVRVTGDGGAP